MRLNETAQNLSELLKRLQFTRNEISEVSQTGKIPEAQLNRLSEWDKALVQIRLSESHKTLSKRNEQLEISKAQKEKIDKVINEKDKIIRDKDKIINVKNL